MADVVDSSITASEQVVSPVPIVTVRNFADAAKTVPFAAVTVYILNLDGSLQQPGVLADNSGIATFAVPAGSYLVHSIWSEQVGGIYIEDDGWNTLTVATSNVTVDVIVWSKGFAVFNGNVTLSKTPPLNVGDTVNVSVPVWNVGVAANIFATITDQTANKTYTNRVSGNLASGATATIVVPVHIDAPVGTHTWLIQVGHVT